MDRSYVPIDEEETPSPYEKLNLMKTALRQDIPPIPIYGIYFICCIGDYKTIVSEQLGSAQQSGLLQKTFMIYCFICQYNPDVMDILTPFLSKLKIITTTENLYEKFALNNVRSYLPKTTPFYLYYFHSKGVSRNSNVFHKTRRNLDYFILERYDVCLLWLKNGYDAVGVSLSLFPLLHFSGNFWWTHSYHFNKLHPTVGDGYYAPEMYICRVPNGNYISICQTTNHKSKEDYLHLSTDQILRQSTCVPIRNTACRRLSV